MAETHSTADQPTIFFLTPIGQEGSTTRIRANHIEKHIIRPVLAESFPQYALSRADRDETPGTVTSQILRSIYEAEIIIADATGGNANVFYELGVADALNKKVILLVDDVLTLPFDRRNQRHLPIGDTGKIGAEEAEVARASLTNYMEAVCADGYRPSSPVTDANLFAQILESDDPIAETLSAQSGDIADLARRMRAVERATPNPLVLSLPDYSHLPINPPSLTSDTIALLGLQLGDAQDQTFRIASEPDQSLSPLERTRPEVSDRTEDPSSANIPDDDENSR